MLIWISSLFSSDLLATTVRVNNTLATNKANKIYASLQEAHDDGTNVTNGDTLLVDGTNIVYAGLTSTKKLVIIGPGYLLTENPQSQANSLPAIVEGITFNPGSEGSILIGMTFSTNSSLHQPAIAADNIAIIRCYLTNGIRIISSINNLVILQNFLLRYGISVNSSLYSFGGVILKNNVLADDISIEQYPNAPRIFTAVEHNNFLGDVKVQTNSFRSNIIVNEDATVEVTSGGKDNNLVRTEQQLAQLPAANGNQVYNETALFVGPEGSDNSTDGQYRLKSNSPYLTAGYNGSEPGIFGGDEPYRLSGVPPIPTIYDIQGDVIGSRQDGLNITVKARVNQ